MAQSGSKINLSSNILKSIAPLE